MQLVLDVIKFQPTPSARRVTSESAPLIAVINISTHTLRKEGDIVITPHIVKTILFQPTPSARRVTAVKSSDYERLVISTHTLRKEGDVFCPIII